MSAYLLLVVGTICLALALTGVVGMYITRERPLDRSRRRQIVRYTTTTR